MDLQDLKPGDVFLAGDTLMLAIAGKSKIQSCYLTNFTRTETFSHAMRIKLCDERVVPTEVICNLMKPFFELQLALQEQGLIATTKEE